MLKNLQMPKSGEVLGGHVVNTVPPVWFDKIRLALIFELQKLHSQNVRFGTVRKGCYEYLIELMPDQEVEIRTYVTRVGNSSVIMQHEAWQGGYLAVTAEMTLVMIDTRLAQSTPIPDSVRAYIDRHLLVDT